MIKKLVALSAVLLTLSSFPLLAQQTATPTAPASAPMGKKRDENRHQAADPITRAQKMSARMTKELGIDEATSKKVYDLAVARAQKVDAIQKSSDANRTKAQALKANADDFKSKLQGILTPDQFSKLAAMKGHMRNGRRGGNAAQEYSDQR